ncbi:hypothetical protein [Petrotoga sp. 9PW.55.5.1]|uniref:hypothetical protein n=1 Tax=Petrotoga sp. 9PW.55.5.1 TaxID=1308979 RepID=UPI001F2FF025|nr:hypothetical protein [Petrotoga sp. 9PW.55.5.1]
MNQFIESNPNFNALETLFVKPESGNIKIDQIRDIDEFLLYKPNYAKYKLVVIENVDKLNKEAANASLKLIEEPPEFTYIFATTTRWNYLLPTIKSRFFRINLNVPYYLSNELQEKYADNSIYLKLFIHQDLGTLLYLLDNETDPISVIDKINVIQETTTEDIEKLINNLKLSLDSAENRMIFTVSYFKLWDLLLKMDERNFFFSIKEINKIKNEVDTLNFLKFISTLGSVFLRDAIVSIISSKWRYFWNNSLVYTFGFNEKNLNEEEIKETVLFFDKIATSGISNYNFELEVITHFLRIRRCFIRH